MDRTKSVARPARLLVVEDEAVVAYDLAARLQRMGYEICGIADSGEEALALARGGEPDLALMDIRLRGSMDGIQAADALQRDLDLPAIFLSANSDATMLERARQTSAYGFLRKPFVESDIQLNIELALQKRKSERDLAAAHAEIQQMNARLEERVHARTAELAAALAEIEGIAYTVAHHFRSPLRALEGYSHLLQAQYADCLPPDAAHYPQAIGASAVQMGRLLDELLAFLGIGRHELDLAPIDLRALACEVVDQLVAGEPARRLETRVQSMPVCTSDAHLVRQLFSELLANALKFTRDCELAVVTVGVQPAAGEPGGRAFFVRDNGVGFDPRFSDKLFTLFSQLNLPEAYEGTGAGLAKARRILDRLGGRIWVESSPGQGATFWFSLPDGHA